MTFPILKAPRGAPCPGEDSLDLEQVEGFVLRRRDLASPVPVGVHGKAIIPEAKFLGHLEHREKGQGVSCEPPERGSEPELIPENVSSRNSARFTPIPELGITRDGNTWKNKQWIKAGAGTTSPELSVPHTTQMQHFSYSQASTA